MSFVPSSSLHCSFPALAFEENSGARFCGDVEAGEVMPKFEEGPQPFRCINTSFLVREIFHQQHFIILHSECPCVYLNGRSCGRFICHFPVHCAHW